MKKMASSTSCFLPLLAISVVFLMSAHCFRITAQLHHYISMVFPLSSKAAAGVSSRVATAKLLSSSLLQCKKPPTPGFNYNCKSAFKYSMALVVYRRRRSRWWWTPGASCPDSVPPEAAASGDVVRPHAFLLLLRAPLHPPHPDYTLPTTWSPKNKQPTVIRENLSPHTER